MNYFHYVFKILFVTIVYITDYVKSECKVTLEKDFSVPQPIFYKNNAIWRPDKNGIYSLKEGGTIGVSCAGENNPILFGEVAFSNDSVVLECVEKQTFRVGLWESAFKDIKCTQQPAVFMKEETRQCFRNNKMHRCLLKTKSFSVEIISTRKHTLNLANFFSVGYNVGKKFIAIYEACFDFNILTTHYVMHTLRPMISRVQPDPEQSFFGSRYLYGNVSMKDVFTYDYQKNKVDSILGKKVTGEFINENLHLTEKFLVPLADLSLPVEQRAAYHYVNIVPQWSIVDGGDWEALENALRVRVIKKASEVVVYTGTFAAVTLPAENGVHRELYMDVSHSYNMDVIPVPLYLYKLVFDPHYNLATVFISINSPHYNKYELEHLIFCDDVCNNNPKFTWLKWQKNDNITSFCCKYDQVQEFLYSLPALEVVGLYF